jgi:hypothetical protein
MLNSNSFRPARSEYREVPMGLKTSSSGVEKKLMQRFEVLTAVKMSMLLFCFITPCRLVGRYHSFGGTYCLHLQV